MDRAILLDALQPQAATGHEDLAGDEIGFALAEQIDRICGVFRRTGAVQRCHRDLLRCRRAVHFLPKFRSELPNLRLIATEIDWDNAGDAGGSSCDPGGDDA